MAVATRVPPTRAERRESPLKRALRDIHAGERAHEVELRGRAESNAVRETIDAAIDAVEQYNLSDGATAQPPDLEALVAGVRRNLGAATWFAS